MTRSRLNTPFHHGKIAFLAFVAAQFLGSALLEANAQSNAQTSEQATTPQVEYVATFIWDLNDEDFGGFSGIELDATGTEFHALSDRGTLWWGQLERDSSGRIRAISVAGNTRLKDSSGKPLLGGYVADSEGLAIGPEEEIYVSFEGLTRVVRYQTPDSPAEVLTSPPEFKAMQRNSSLEALAVLPDGTLLTLPERSGMLTRPFPVWRWQDGSWSQPFTIRRSGQWLPVGADIGPDGRLYLLERDFRGLLGFSSRVRRFDLGSEGVSNEQVLLTTRSLQYDNLEGISVWHDGRGIRLTMISDDNQYVLQRTELVEYRVLE